MLQCVLAEPSLLQTVADMVQQCREVLFPNKFLRVEGWALVEAAGYSFLESSQKEEDCVMMQCREQSQLCIASYNSDLEQPVCFIRIPMSNIEKIVIGKPQLLSVCLPVHVEFCDYVHCKQLQYFRSLGHAAA